MNVGGMSWVTIGTILVLGIMYIAVASHAIDTFAACDKLQGDTVQDNLHSTLVVSLTIALVVPVTLLVSKMFGDKVSFFMIMYGILGIIASGAGIHWTTQCPEAKDDAPILPSIGMVMFLLSAATGGFLMTRGM